MIVTLNLAVLLAVIIFFRVRRQVQARSRSDQWLTVAIVFLFGLLVAPTDFGQGTVHVIGQLVEDISHSEDP